MKKLVILGVDDDETNIKLLKVFLNKYPHLERLEIARTGQEALDKLEEFPDIDIILLDIIMPVKTGLEVLEERMITDSKKLKDVAIIMLTTDETKKNESIDKGANDFLTKPVNKNLLYEKLDLFREALEQK